MCNQEHTEKHLFFTFQFTNFILNPNKHRWKGKGTKNPKNMSLEATSPRASQGKAQSTTWVQVQPTLIPPVLSTANYKSRS